MDSPNSCPYCTDQNPGSPEYLKVTSVCPVHGVNSTVGASKPYAQELESGFFSDDDL